MMWTLGLPEGHSGTQIVSENALFPTLRGKKPVLSVWQMLQSTPGTSLTTSLSVCVCVCVCVCAYVFVCECAQCVCVCARAHATA